MGSVLHELDNHALLILHVAGELPDEDRADIEQLLRTDPVLAAGLRLARTDAVAAAAAVEATDRLDPAAGTTASAEAVALRRVGQACRQWQVERLVRSRPAPAAEPQPRLPSWAYPVGLAATVLLAAGGWWGWRVHNGAAHDLARRGSPGDEGGLGGRLVADVFGLGGGLDDAEGQARSLGRMDDDPSNLPTIVQDGSAD